MSAKPCSKAALLLGVALLSMACQDYGTGDRTSIKIKHNTYDIAAPQKIDILFVVDNSSSMLGKQIALSNSFVTFADILNHKAGRDSYRVALITTAMESDYCLPCPDNDPDYRSCLNESGESGRFQDRLGHNTGTMDNPHFEFEIDPSCKIMDSSNIERCLYDPAKNRGLIFTGTNGCGYERGLAAMRAALSEPLASTYNATDTGAFLRDDAELVVIVISDEEDCGEVGEVTEGVTQIGAKICYYASNGMGPDGSYEDPAEGLAYSLTPLDDYRDFLLGLKGGRAGNVKFVAITGVEDEDDPSSTKITFDSKEQNASPLPSCSVPGCTAYDDYCDAYPGTRYIGLAQKFGRNGMSMSICKENFGDPIVKLGNFVACPSVFRLTEKIVDPALASIFINDVKVPRYSCSGSEKDHIEVCSGTKDKSCSAGDCVKTWTYKAPEEMDPPDPAAPGGEITFASHYDPCDLISDGEIHIDLIYVTQ